MSSTNRWFKFYASLFVLWSVISGWSWKLMVDSCKCLKIAAAILIIGLFSLDIRAENVWILRRDESILAAVTFLIYFYDVFFGYVGRVDYRARLTSICANKKKTAFFPALPEQPFDFVADTLHILARRPPTDGALSNNLFEIGKSKYTRFFSRTQRINIKSNIFYFYDKGDL